MRLTLFLNRGKRTHRDVIQLLTKKHWSQKGSQIKVNRLRVPPQILNDPANPLYKAEDMFSSTRYEDQLAEEIELGLDPREASYIKQARTDRLAAWSAHANDIRYHSDIEPCLMFTNKRRFTKGIDQASLLTNTIVIQDQLPIMASINKNVDDLMQSWDPNWSDDLRNLVERAVLHSHVWHTDETKLPRRFRPNLPIWKHKTEYGIHPEQITRYLFQDLFRILELQVLPKLQNSGNPLGLASYNGNLPPRWTTYDRLLETYYDWNAYSKRRIRFAEHHDLVVNGKTANPLFVSDPNEIQELCRRYQLPIASHGPMSPLIDLTSSKYYRLDSTDGWINAKNRLYPHPHILTINLSLPNVWSDFLEPEADRMTAEQRQAHALMHCFAATVACSHSLGIHEGDLETPICVYGICSDGVYFDFIAYQLNTLDIRDPKSESKQNRIRNMAWIDGSHRLVDKRIPIRSMLRNTKYYDLDMSVFRRLSSCYFWGMIEDKHSPVRFDQTASPHEVKTA